MTRAWAEADRSAVLADSTVREAVATTIEGLDEGTIRVASKVDGAWQVHAWTKQAILLWFGMRPNEPLEAGDLRFLDKIRPKTRLEGVRVVPPGVARHGSHLEPGVILMPGYVNIGARVGTGTMVDTWATVGSCAQIGAHVHLSGGVGIGGVLEPPAARPVIIEDGVFVGSRCIVVEGVLVEEEAVLGAGVVLTASTPIIDVTGPEPVTIKGRVPARSVVIPGTRPKEYPAGTFHVPCALIVGQRNASTDRKTSLNEALRGFDIAT
ncbi:MAG: 2,3,4,5-tetrahydropyridine-2,6-dicarboxylate N-succinyltransferase [Candidatus Sericytochromatia bacterium]|nr:2,3,4,5-tetrahydropyridine-2,6-dicarboxylate N-succinyltransferase [Candidatus Sericytochromatia bacterium]